MTYTMDSPLLATGVLSRAELVAAANDMPKPLDGDTVADLQETTGLDGTIMLAHMILETGSGTSDFWVSRNNPGGIGAVDSAPGNALSFASPREGIIADFSHMLTYVRREDNPMRATDPRYRVTIEKTIAGNLRTVGQLGNGVWATDPNYAGKVVHIANALVARYHRGSGTAVPPAQGGSVMVPDQSYSLPVRLDLANNGKSFVDRPTNSSGAILAIVKHVTAGESLDGALSWNRNPSVQASAHFYIDKDGTTVQDVSLFNGAWANGVLDNDTLPAQFDDMKTNGWNPNDFTISIEHVGNPDDADFPTPQQRTADARLCADLCDYFHIPVDTDHIVGHYRFDSVNRPNCPGDHWDFDADVRAISRLLNGETSDGNTANPPADGQPDVGGVGTSTGSDSGGARPNGGDQGSGSGISAGAGDANGGGNVPGSANDWGRAIGNGMRVGDESTDGDGRGFTIRYDGDPGPGIRVGHGFFDKYAADGFDVGYARYGLVRASEFAGFVPGIVNAVDPTQPVTVQIFTFAAFVWDGANVRELPSGVLTAHWLQTHGVVIPADMHW